MTPHGRKPRAVAFVMLHRREVLDLVVAPVHAHRADLHAIAEGLADALPSDLPSCFYGDVFCGCGECTDYCEACGGICCGLADEQGRCDCAEERRRAAALADEQRVTIASRIPARAA